MEKGKLLHIINTILFGLLIIVFVSFSVFIRTKIQPGWVNMFYLIIIFVSLILGFIYFIFDIKAFKKCNLNNWWFYASFIINILCGIVIILIIRGLYFLLPNNGANELSELFAIYTLYLGPLILIGLILISSIIFLIGYFKNKK